MALIELNVLTSLTGDSHLIPPAQWSWGGRLHVSPILGTQACPELHYSCASLHPCLCLRGGCWTCVIVLLPAAPDWIPGRDHEPNSSPQLVCHGWWNLLAMPGTTHPAQVLWVWLCPGWEGHCPACPTTCPLLARLPTPSSPLPGHSQTGNAGKDLMRAPVQSQQGTLIQTLLCGGLKAATDFAAKWLPNTNTSRCITALQTSQCWSRLRVSCCGNAMLNSPGNIFWRMTTVGDGGVTAWSSLW